MCNCGGSPRCRPHTGDKLKIVITETVCSVTRHRAKVNAVMLREISGASLRTAKGHKHPPHRHLVCSIGSKIVNRRLQDLNMS